MAALRAEGLLRLAAALVAALALCSCSGSPGVPAGGDLPPRVLQITFFNYMPPDTIHLGDTLTCTARILEQDVVAAEVLITGELAHDVELALHDDGVAPDVTAQDRIFTGALYWDPGLGTGINAVSLGVTARIGGVLYEDKRLAPWLHVEP